MVEVGNFLNAIGKGWCWVGVIGPDGGPPEGVEWQSAPENYPLL